MNLDATLDELNRKHREANTFDVYCFPGLRNPKFFRHDKTRIIKSQLKFEDAERLAVRLEERYRLRHPNVSSWVARIYGVQLHVLPKIKTCPICGTTVGGKAVFCSARCRKVSSRAAKRHSSRSATVTGGAT